MEKQVILTQDEWHIVERCLANDVTRHEAEYANLPPTPAKSDIKKAMNTLQRLQQRIKVQLLKQSLCK